MSLVNTQNIIYFFILDHNKTHPFQQQKKIDITQFNSKFTWFINIKNIIK